VLGALDSALVGLFDLPNAPTTLRDADISFEAPAKDYRPSLSTVNLFLVGVRENADLRSSEPIVEDVGGVAQMRPPAVRVDCQYLLTAWATAGLATPGVRIQAEHQLFGVALAWLSSFAALPASVLGTDLASQPYPIQLRVAQPRPDREDAELWTALGTPPRTHAWISATVALLLTGAEVIEAPRADTLEISLLDEPIFTVGGIVVGADTSRAIAAATVSLLDTGRSTTTDDRGRFLFPDLATGDYQLSVSAAHYKTSKRSVHVPPDVAQEFDTQLTPVS
jgi:hypothetical protein